MKIIDISWLITPDMTGYKDKREVIFTSTRLCEQEHIRESHLMLSSHTGTHVEAPSHVFDDGKTIDQVPLQNLIGQALVADLTHVEEVISADDLAPFDCARGSILLLKTRNSELLENAPFEPSFVYLDTSAAVYCVEQNVKAVGIDYIGIERNQPDYATRKLLFEHNIPIIEGLRLHHVVMGYYFFICLPLHIAGLEAAPARAVLIDYT